MDVFDDDGKPLGTTPIFRFYFDGLTAQFRIPDSQLPIQPLGPAGVGNEARFAVMTAPFETSRQGQDEASVEGPLLKAVPNGWLWRNAAVPEGGESSGVG
jgi:hypothetical protein